MQLKGPVGGLPVVAMAGCGLDGLPEHGGSSGPGSPSKARRHGRRGRRLLQAALALMGVWLCCTLLGPSSPAKKQLGAASAATAAADRADTAVGGVAATGGAAGSAASLDGAVGGAAGAKVAAHSAVWPTSDDVLAQELEARRVFLRQQQQVRHQLAANRAAAAARPHTGFLPEPPPKVALMFLVRGNMPQEPVWRSFFEAASQVGASMLRRSAASADWYNSARMHWDVC